MTVAYTTVITCSTFSAASVPLDAAVMRTMTRTSVVRSHVPEVTATPVRNAPSVPASESPAIIFSSRQPMPAMSHRHAGVDVFVARNDLMELVATVHAFERGLAHRFAHLGIPRELDERRRRRRRVRDARDDAARTEVAIGIAAFDE